MRGVAYSADGVPIVAMQGRPPKPALSPEEFEAVVAILTLPKGTHGSSLDRAALEVSMMRGMHLAVDPRTRKARSVSGRWIGMQLAQMGYSGKNGLREKLGTSPRKHQVGLKSQNVERTGSRMGYSTVQESTVISEPAFVTGENGPTQRVDSERTGAKA